jgi:hypothetical protein
MLDGSSVGYCVGWHGGGEVTEEGWWHWLTAVCGNAYK